MKLGEYINLGGGVRLRKSTLMILFGLTLISCLNNQDTSNTTELTSEINNKMEIVKIPKKKEEKKSASFEVAIKKSLKEKINELYVRNNLLSPSLKELSDNKVYIEIEIDDDNIDFYKNLHESLFIDSVEYAVLLDGDSFGSLPIGRKSLSVDQKILIFIAGK